MNLNRLAYFAAVIDAGSFTRAAETLGITKAVVSQQVMKLEEEIGTALLVRTTRNVHATDAGRALNAHCGVILREAADAFDELAQGAATPQGTLRVTAPFDYGASVIVPIITEFTRLHARCQVVLTVSDRALDTPMIDVAVRIGWLRDSTRQARRIGSFHQRLVCVPSLAKSFRRLREPSELVELPFIANDALPEPLVWRFTRGAGHQCTVRMRSAFAIDATPAVHAAVLAGAGLSVLPDYLVDTDIAAGRLQHILPEWTLRTGGIHVLFPATRYRPAKVNRFVELLIQFETERQARARV